VTIATRRNRDPTTGVIRNAIGGFVQMTARSATYNEAAMKSLVIAAGMFAVGCHHPDDVASDAAAIDDARVVDDADTGDGVPAKGTPVFADLLLQQDAPRLIRAGQPFAPFGAIPCCMEFQPLPAGVPVSSRWPLASEAWMDYTAAHGANFFHFRLGPFYADADHETEWADVGGPYVADGPAWNPAFWDKVRQLAWYAGKHWKANVEVDVIDTWYCKHAQWGDQQMPWPLAEIDACGRAASPEQERYIRKAVEELGCFANVTWLTDNEGDQIQGTQRDWYVWVQSVIRDEEQHSGCAITHLLGTNNTDFTDGTFDFVATHAKAELSQPIAGKHVENNERNPAFSPAQEYANFCTARTAGLHWWLWRADMSDADFETTLASFGGGC
jgi:hypothetical protein